LSRRRFFLSFSRHHHVLPLSIAVPVVVLVVFFFEPIDTKENPIGLTTPLDDDMHGIAVYLYIRSKILFTVSKCFPFVVILTACVFAKKHKNT
jgi:hypothetical protein